MMLAGEKPASCLKCYKEEVIGHRPQSAWETQYWINNGIDVDKLVEETYEDGSTDAKLVYIDIRMGTKCQLGCVMCSHMIQVVGLKTGRNCNHKLKTKVLKRQWYGLTKVKSLVQVIIGTKTTCILATVHAQIPNMKQLYFAGGEPTVIDEHYEILRQSY